MGEKLVGKYTAQVESKGFM